MKLPRKKRDETSATITQTLALILACSAVCALTAYASDPAWWNSRGAVSAPVVTTNDGVVTTNYVQNDYDAVTQGQLKRFTQKAVEELNADLSGGAGTNLNNLVTGWSNDYYTNGYNATNIKPSDYTAMSVGQLKYIGNMVWAQLVASGYTSSAPSWLALNTNTDNQAANIGQLKEVFNFAPAINPLAPVISSTTATETIGVDFSYTITASNTPTSYSATGLPAGLSLDTSTGVISGTPTAVGTFAVYLSATNAYGTGTVALTLTVNPPAPVISSVTAANGTVGTAFSYAITASNSATSFSETGLPTGLSLNTSTGVICGTPTATGTSTVDLSATSAYGTGTATLTLTVNASAPVSGIGIQFQGSGTALLSTDSAGLLSAYQSNWNVLGGYSFTDDALSDSSGASTTATLSGSAGGTYSGGGSSASPAGNASLASGELNNGSWTGSPTLTVSDIPYAQYDVYVYAAMDATGRQETMGLTPDGGTEQFYSFTTEGGGSAWTVATNTWNGSDTPPTLPSANYVHYTNLTASSFTLAWGASGNGAINGIQIVPIVSVSAAPVIRSATAASGAAGTAFNYTITATNTPTSYSATGLPAGLSVNTSTGVISGTPMAVGTSLVNLSATNAYGTGTAALTLTVNASSGIGIQFQGSGTALLSSDSAGLVSVVQNNWNVLGGNSFTDDVLSDGSGASTTATLSGSAGGNYSGGESSASPAGNASLASGEIYNSWPSSSTLTVSDIPYAQYDVYVYAAMDATGREETMGLTPGSGTEQFYSFTTEGGGSAWTVATNAWNGTGTAPSLRSANYVHYKNLTASSFTLAWGAPGNGAINGIQIVPALIAATPTLSLSGGTYSSSQTVTLSSTTSGATIYYTTNGSTPTTSSSSVSSGGTITVSASETVKAIAVASGYTNSSVASASYTIETVAATPTFSPGAGTYTSTQTVTLSSSTSGATIYYTTDGSTPTTSSSSVASGGTITVGVSETLEAIAVAAGYTNSTTFTAAYIIAPPSTGLTLWLKADAGVTGGGTTPTNGGSVDTWTDQTSSYTVTQGTGGNQPTYVTNDVNGRPALRFNGSAWLSNSSTMTGVNADMTMIAVAMTTSPASLQNSVALGNGTASESRNMGYYSGAELLDITANHCSGAAVPNANFFVEEAVTLDSSLTNVAFYRNGVQTATSTISGVGNVSSGIMIGNRAEGLGAPWQGDIAEVLVYNHKLTSTELAEVDGYLANKYAYYSPNATWPLAYSSEVQAEITRNQWNKTQADNYVALETNNSTMLTHGLVFWCKADSADVSRDGSGNVNSWTDQTGNYTVTQSGTTRPTYVANDINGQAALRFNGSQWLGNPSSLGNGVNADITMIAVAMTTSPTSLQNTLALGNGTAYQSRNIGYYSSDQLLDIAAGHSSGAAVPLANVFVAETVTLDSSLTNVAYYRNGIETDTGTLSGVQSVSPELFVGNRGGDFGAAWQGDIAEVLIYDHKLTSAELNQVDGYLADRYGYYSLNATWPSTYSSAVQAEITKHQWSKAQADAYVTFQASNSTMLTNGLTIWLKADDSGAITLDGSSNVISWADETGNYTVSQSNSSDRPAYISSDLDGKPGLRFSGSQGLSNSSLPDPGLNADMTIITVGMTTAPSAQTYSLYLGQSASAGANRAVGYYLGNELFDTYGSYVSGGTAPTSGTFLAEVATLDRTISNVAFYQNGAVTGTGGMSGVQMLSSGVTVGAAGGGACPWQGDIVEELVYDHKLSPAELQQVSLYLSNKYGLAYNAAVDISPSGGSYASSQTVTMSTAISGGTIHYTVDGSQPTASSPTYSSSITVSASALVQAVVTVSGTIVSPVVAAQYYINDSGDTGLPIAPTSLTATSISGIETDLAWSLSGMVDYDAINIYRSTNGGSYVLIDVLDPASA